MKTIYYILLYLLFWGYQNPVIAQEQVQALLDTTSMELGDQVGLHLRIDNAAGVTQPAVNMAPLHKVTEIEIIEEQDWDTLDIMGNRVFQKDLILTSFDSGYYFIPALTIQYKKDGKNIARTTNQLALAVNPPPVDPTNPAPIKPIIQEPLGLQDILPYLLGVLAMLGLILFIRWYQKRRHAVKRPPPPPVVVPAHEIALRKLKELREAKLWQQGKTKAYQSQLTYIVREYLENRYDIQALEQTSDEVLQALRQKNIAEEHQTQLRQMFTMADLVKFAKAQPPVDANQQLMDYAETFVRKTKQVETEENINN